MILTHSVAKALAEDRTHVSARSRHLRRAEERQRQLRAQRRANRRTSRMETVRRAWASATELFVKPESEAHQIVQLPESDTIRPTTSVKETASRR